MSNSISYAKKGIRINMNNQRTDIVYATLLLTGSMLAQTDREKKFLIWLAEYDQSIIGGGLVDIDIDDIFGSKD